MYNILLRRDQMKGVEACVQKFGFTKGEREGLESLTANGLVATALASGEVDSVKEALRKKNLEAPVRKAWQQVQISQRNVKGSEAERDNIMPKFMGMRIWAGCASLFFTLNPHDIRSPITLVLL